MNTQQLKASLNKDEPQHEAAGIVGSHGISLDLPGVDENPTRPPIISHLYVTWSFGSVCRADADISVCRSTPAYESPLRHHRRKASTPRQVKETLHARSEYTNSQDDGTAIHRINQYVIKQEIGRGSFGAVHLAVDQHGNEYVSSSDTLQSPRARAWTVQKETLTSTAVPLLKLFSGCERVLQIKITQKSAIQYPSSTTWRQTSGSSRRWSRLQLSVTPALSFGYS